MKRHPCFRPWSRDHHRGLVHARELRWAVQAGPVDQRHAIRRFAHEWEHRLREHFAQEEQWLPRLTSEPALVGRLLRDHAAIRELAEALIQDDESGDLHGTRMLALSDHLQDHIRWEERELFPALEAAHPPLVLETFERQLKRDESSTNNKPPRLS